MNVIRKHGNWKIKKKTDIYVHVECISFLFRFRDDLELLIDAET